MTTVIVPHVANNRANSPTILGKSAVAVPLTGTTNETTLATISVPGGSMGLNGQIESILHFTYTSSANNKILRLKLGATTFWQITATTTANYQLYTRICNRNSTSSQVHFTLSAGTSGFGQSGSAVTTGVIDTTADQDITITGQLASAAETIQLESYLIILNR